MVRLNPTAAHAARRHRRASSELPQPLQWLDIVWALAMKEAGETSMILGWPVWVAQILMVPGFLLMALAGFYMVAIHWHLGRVNSGVAA